MNIQNMPAQGGSASGGKIYIGTDHAGYGLKDKLTSSLQAQGYEIIDKGAFAYNEGDDYPDFTIPVAREVSKDPENARGIILGATGEAEAITANKFPHVRAVAYYGEAQFVVDDHADIITRSRENNNTNVLSLGVRYLNEEAMMKVVNLWLTTPFGGGEKHIRRLAKIDNIQIND